MKITVEINNLEENPVVEIEYTDEEKADPAGTMMKTTSSICEIIMKTLETWYPDDLLNCRHLADYFVEQIQTGINDCFDELKKEAIEEFPIGEILEEMFIDWLNDKSYKSIEELVEKYKGTKMGLKYWIRGNSAWIYLASDDSYAEHIITVDCENDFEAKIMYAYLIAMFVLDHFYTEESNPLRQKGNDGIDAFSNEVKNALLNN